MLIAYSTLRKFQSITKDNSQSSPAGAEEPDHSGGILMRWLWKREARLIEPRRAANTRVLELETAKEILAEVFHARPSEVEEMIQIRLEKRESLTDETDLWPATFCLGE